MSVYLENHPDPEQGRALPSKPEKATTLGVYTTENRALRELPHWAATAADRACLRVCETERGFEVVRLPYRAAERA